MQVYLIRHPEPVGIDGRCYGRTDVRVEEAAILGIATSVSARISAGVLASARIYCSPLARCLGLAQHIASPREPIPTDDLIEMNFAAWEGLAWDAVPRDEIEAWARDVWGYQPGGGESAAMVALRWHRWLNRVRQCDAGTIVAVTHAGVIRVALACSAQSSDAVTAAMPIPFGAIYRLDLG